MAEMTGRKVLVITVSAFGVIIAVNFLLAYKAVSTFPGLEVPNSYVASQTFDADRAAQLALGWSLAADYDHGASILELVFTDAGGAPAPVAASTKRATAGASSVQPGQEATTTSPLSKSA